MGTVILLIYFTLGEMTIFPRPDLDAVKRDAGNNDGQDLTDGPLFDCKEAEPVLQGDTLHYICTSFAMFEPFGSVTSIEKLAQQLDGAHQRTLECKLYEGQDSETVSEIQWGESRVRFVRGEKHDYQIVSGRILDEGLPIYRVIRPGINEETVIRILVGKRLAPSIKFRVLELESGLAGIWHFYVFEDDKLKAILFVSDFEIHCPETD